MESQWGAATRTLVPPFSLPFPRGACLHAQRGYGRTNCIFKLVEQLMINEYPSISRREVGVPPLMFGPKLSFVEENPCQQCANTLALSWFTSNCVNLKCLLLNFVGNAPRWPNLPCQKFRFSEHCCHHTNNFLPPPPFCSRASCKTGHLIRPGSHNLDKHPFIVGLCTGWCVIRGSAGQHSIADGPRRTASHLIPFLSLHRRGLYRCPQVRNN